MKLDIPYILNDLAQKHTKKFMYQGKEVERDQWFSPTGTLPVLVRKAGLLCDFLFAEPLHVSYTSNPDALTGEELVISDRQHLFTLVMLLYDVVEELVVNAGDGDVVLS